MRGCLLFHPLFTMFLLNVILCQILCLASHQGFHSLATGVCSDAMGLTLLDSTFKWDHVFLCWTHSTHDNVFQVDVCCDKWEDFLLSRRLNRGWCSGALGYTASCKASIPYDWSSAQLVAVLFLIPVKAPAKQTQNGPCAWSLPLRSETWKEFQTPGFNLGQS